MREETDPAVQNRSPFGLILRRFRIAAGLSQEALAERAALSADGISMLERGARRAPHRDTVAVLAKALMLSVDDYERLQAAAVRIPIPRRRETRSEPFEATSGRNLPLPLTSFHGREVEIELLKLRLTEARLITLVGTGGVGKTRLALETARATADGYADGAWCVELAPLGDSELIAQRIATTLGLAIARFKERAAGAALLAQLAAKRLLIVLDNCEHVLAGVAPIAQQILERCPGVRVIATSREALRVAGEYVVRVDPLGVPAFHGGRAPSLVDLRASPAVALFLERARLVAPTMKLGEDARAWHMLGSICARLDGIPLAIELAAGRMNAMTLDTLLRALDGRFALLTNGARSALPRHQTLHALIDWSYDLLEECERRVFRRLGAFSGGCTLEFALAVCADDDAASYDVLATLTSLVDKSLIVADLAGHDVRYRMLETIHAYAQQRLLDAGERHATARRHAQHLRDLLVRNDERWGTVPMAEWIAPLTRDIDNLRAALRWSLDERHDVRLGATIATVQSRVFESLSLLDEGRLWCERSLAALAPNIPQELEAPLQLALAKHYVRGTNFVPAVEAGARSSELYRTMLQTPHQHESASVPYAIALSYTGFALASLGRLEEADATASGALAVLRTESNVAAQAFAFIVKTWCVTDVAMQRASAARALALARSLPPGYSFEGIALIGMSVLDFDAGDLECAYENAIAATASFRSSRLHESLCSVALSIAAACLFLSEDTAGGVACALDGLSTFENGTFVHNMIDSVQTIAGALTFRGRPADAARLTGGCEAFYVDRVPPRSACGRAVYERTLALLKKNASGAQVEIWLAEGRLWRYGETVAAALELELASRGAVSNLYG